MALTIKKRAQEIIYYENGWYGDVIHFSSIGVTVTRISENICFGRIEDNVNELRVKFNSDNEMNLIQLDLPNYIIPLSLSGNGATIAKNFDLGILVNGSSAQLSASKNEVGMFLEIIFFLLFRRGLSFFVC